MAAPSTLSSFPPQPLPILLHSHHSLQLLTNPLRRKTPTVVMINCAGAPPMPAPKLVRCRALDLQASRASRLRFARKLLTLLLSKPRRFLPLRVLRRCRRFLGLPPRRPLVPFLLRFPTLFRLFHSPTSSPLSPSLSTLSVALTPAASAVANDLALLRATRLAPALAAKLHRLLLLTPHRRLALSKLAHLAPDLGLAMDFRATLCPRHPHLFSLVHTSHGHALQLADPPPPPPPPLPPLRPPSPSDRLIDRPPKFPRLPLPLRRGLNLRRAHREYLLRFHALPDVLPFEPLSEGASVEMAERRACAVVREVLGMTVERRTLVDHLTHFRRDFGLPNRLRAMLVRHPEMFYVSMKGVRHSVFLVEAFDDDGRLVVEDELLAGRDRLEELVREGKRLRRTQRRGLVSAVNDSGDDDEDDDDGEGDLSGVDGEFGDLFEDSGIGEDWKEVGDRGGSDEDDEEEDAELDAMDEFWVKKAVADGLVESVKELDAW